MELERMPMPKNDAELEVLTKWYFGRPLHLLRLDAYGDYASYEVREDFNTYGKYRLFKKPKLDDYDYSLKFWNVVIGVLYCGGTARASYGQTRVKGYRQQKRLADWVLSRRRNEPGRLRKPFARLARQLSGRERTERGAHRSVLTNGRVDGALGASFSNSGR